MKTRTVSSLTPKVNDILTITLEGILPDLRPLSAAIFLSDPDEVIRIRQLYPADHIVHLAVKAACDFHRDAALRETYIDGGFFTEQLEHFLCTAKKNRDAGARLMPVFCTALTHAGELKIPTALQERILSHIEWQRMTDGFAITKLSQDEIIVVPADDVIPA